MKFIIAGGGTGGHIFTGIAMAEKIESKYPDSEILFIGTKYGLEKNIVPSQGYNLKYITVRGLKGKSVFITLRNLAILPLGIIQSLIIIKRFQPDVVFGVGGYASGPVGIVASKLGIPLVIIEQNSIPGITNRILSKHASFAAVAFKMADKFITCETVLSGVPLRKEFQVKKQTKRDKKFQILILGGSQGAKGINQAIINALPMIKKLGKEICIIHQTGKSSLADVSAEYAKFDLKVNVVEFIEDIHSLYEKTDIVISRAGAITIAEIKAMRIPSILYPRFRIPSTIINTITQKIWRMREGQSCC